MYERWIVSALQLYVRQYVNMHCRTTSNYAYLNILLLKVENIFLMQV